MPQAESISYSRLHNTVVERENDRGRSIAHVQLIEDTPDVRLHRAFANAEPFGNLVIRQPSPDEPQHLKLALREVRQARLSCGWRRLTIRRQHATSDRGIQVRATRGERPHRAQ